MYFVKQTKLLIYNNKLVYIKNGSCIFILTSNTNQMKNLLLLLLFTIPLTYSCNSKKDSKTQAKETTETKTKSKKKEVTSETSESFDPIFPSLKNVDSLNSTIFIPTIENEFSTDKNAIYAATIGFAWNRIKDTLGINFIENNDLALINNSKAFKNSPKKREYTTELSLTKDPKTGNNLIKSRAYFKKLLPFSRPLQRYNTGLKFKDKPIPSFGFKGHGPIRILYYNNDNDFAIALYPKDKDHEIILYKTDFKKSISLSKELKTLNNKVTEFKKDKSNGFISRRMFNHDDRVKVPIIKFHLENDFENIVGSKFTDKESVIWELLQFYQKNAFILNENGAIVESEAIEGAVDAAVEMPAEPKKLFFDKSFIVMLKRKDSDFPYFATFIANDELLEK